MKTSNIDPKKSGKKVPLAFTLYPRCAGILLHITFLPSSFGIGDFGLKAYEFADFLRRSYQTIWQILPINSTSEEEGFSPYASNGSFAGNVLLISPEQLVTDGWLTLKDIQAAEVKNSKATDYQKAHQAKNILLTTAYNNYKNNPASAQKAFASFCKEEDYWLHDYALYIILKKENENKSWNQWTAEYKNRDAKALQVFAKGYEEELEKVKWQQWIFHKQWFELKRYCNNINVNIFGDLPFYVAYDSADVWANQHLFRLDKDGNMEGESGAPPDDFNADGQRWGMPVYRWDIVRKEKYKWWLSRMKKNIAMFDLLRLDHFRGFSAYWEIKPKAKSAKNGEWKPVQGTEFFTLLQSEVGSLPLVAEDLGTIDAPVIKLREQFNIPGMVIQQVSFGDDMPQSQSIPHHHKLNSIVYTGNHDNNTTRSWYQSLPQNLAKNISLYTNKTVEENNVCEVMSRLIYASVAKLAILPMQDILNLDARARMNGVPDGSASWSWRMPAQALIKKIENYLQDLCYLYDRKPKFVT